MTLIMTLSKLDAEHLYLATLAGCHAVVRERETLNAINVFPVQDGDTGDNMAATASAVIHHASLQQSIKHTLQSVADASLSGARGNSGMIFSQFFNALADGATDEEHLNLSKFSDLLHLAATRVRSAILNPVDGTMLTIMECWSTYIKESVHEASCFKILLQAITSKLHDAVNQTTEALEALKAAEVVDAGALGFFHFVSGFSHFIANPNHLPEIQSLPKLSLTHDNHEVCANTRPQQGRYCTEAMIRTENLDSNQLMEVLKQHGESIVISANAHLCRFHLHTDKPWELFTKLRSLGRIYQPKVDDMLRQFQTLRERLSPIALVTDSNADLPSSYLDAHQIHLIPINIHIDEHDLLDKYSIQSDDFYKQLNTGHTHPKTSCPSLNAIQQKLKPLSEKYEHVLILSLAQSLSGTHDALKSAASAYPNVQVINTHHCSATQGLLVIEAGKAIKNGASVDEVRAEVERLIPKTHFWFMVSDLHALIRSGRVNKILGKVAQFSGIKPLFTLNAEGNATLTGQAFNEQAALQKILHTIQLRLQQGEKLKTYCIVHADAHEEAKAFARLTTQTFGIPPAYTESVSVAIGVHAGPGCLGLAAIFE